MSSPFRDNGKLVAGIAGKDKAALEYFFKTYYHGLLIYVGHDEDSAIEAVEKAIASLHLYNSKKSKFITWVYRIARNIFLKKKKNARQIPVDYLEDHLV